VDEPGKTGAYPVPSSKMRPPRGTAAARTASNSPTRSSQNIANPARSARACASRTTAGGPAIMARTPRPRSAPIRSSTPRGDLPHPQSYETSPFRPLRPRLSRRRHPTNTGPNHGGECGTRRLWTSRAVRRKRREEDEPQAPAESVGPYLQDRLPPGCEKTHVSDGWETWNASAPGAYELTTEVTSSISATWAKRPSMAWRTVGSFTPWSAWKTIWVSGATRCRRRRRPRPG
jgi:hypothetical protein